MGQHSVKPSSRFPENFARVPPSSRHCRGPGLLEELNSKTRDILPKCFEGAHLKLRKNVSKNLDVGCNVVFSAVTPSGGHFAADYLNQKTGNSLEFTLSPSGAVALHTKTQLSTSLAVDVNSQLHLRKHPVGSVSLEYSRLRTSAAVCVSACAVPFKVFHHDADIFEKIHVKNDITMTLGLQCVRRVGDSWVVGGRWNVGRDVRAAAAVELRGGRAGVLAGRETLQAWWLRRAAERLALGGTLETRWDGREAAARACASWHCPGTLVRASCGTDGLVACTVRRTLFQGEETHFALLLSGLLNQRNDKFRLGLGFEGYA